MPLFTGVRGIRILGSSLQKNSPKFAKITHLGYAPLTLVQAVMLYPLQHVRWSDVRPPPH
jgi:hypothetical protein